MAPSASGDTTPTVLRAAVSRTRWARLVADLRSEPDDVSLHLFLERHDHRLPDVYRSNRSWTQLRRDAGRSTHHAGHVSLEASALKALSRLTHLDDPERVAFYGDLLAGERPPRDAALDERHRRLLTMLAWGFGSGQTGEPSLDAYFQRFWREEAVRKKDESQTRADTSDLV